MKRTLLCAALALAPALPAAAFDPAAMTEPQRAAFGAAVRDYLLANPGLVYEMLAQVESTRMEDEAEADHALIGKWSELLFADPGDPVMGNPDGDVTLVMFTDHRCPYCRATEADLAALVETDPGLRVVIKHYPVLTPESSAAAAFALAALALGGPKAHAAAHARLYDLRGGYTDGAFRRLAAEIGLPEDEVMARMQDDAVKTRIASTLALGREFGFDATPSFVLPQLLVRGQVPAEAMARYVAEARSKDR